MNLNILKTNKKFEKMYSIKNSCANFIIKKLFYHRTIFYLCYFNKENKIRKYIGNWLFCDNVANIPLIFLNMSNINNCLCN